MRLCCLLWRNKDSKDAVADPKNVKSLKRGGAEDNLSAPPSFSASEVTTLWRYTNMLIIIIIIIIANTHNEIYAYYTEKSGFLKKNMSH